MSKFWRIIFVFALVVSPAFTATASASPIKNQLTATEPMMKGHIVALYMNHLIVSLGPMLDWDTPVLVSFTEAEGCIELEILGGRGSIDGAKGTTDSFREQLLLLALAGVNDLFGLSLEEKDLIITYINKNKFEKVLTFKNGSYAIE